MRLCQKLLQLGILALQRPQPPGLRHLEPVEPALPVVERRLADPVCLRRQRALIDKATQVAADAEGNWLHGSEMQPRYLLIAAALGVVTGSSARMKVTAQGLRVY
jgi:hypothetical protein